MLGHNAAADRSALGVAESGIALLLLAVSASCAVLAQANSPTAQKVLPVRIGEAKMDNEHTVTSSDCVLVLPDGRLHLERRREAKPNSTATLKIFESSLDSCELEQLRGIIKDEEASGLPEYDRQRVFFQNAPCFTPVTVDIGEGTTARRFGYWAWDKRNAGPDVPASVRTHWQDSEVALRPLVEWLHRIEASNLMPSDAESTLCSVLAIE
jgi:hypothetical protein